MGLVTGQVFILDSPLSTISMYCLLKWQRMEVKPHQSVVIKKRSLTELESMKEEFHHLQHTSWTRVIQIVLSDVSMVSIDMILWVIYM